MSTDSSTGSSTPSTASTPPARPPLHVPVNPVRFVTAASLFDGHDAAINIMRRVLQSQGAEVVHLGHDRSVDAVVAAAVQEDVQGVGISSLPGRARRVLHLPQGAPGRGRRRPRAGLRRRRRRDRPRRDRAAARPRRTGLRARGRPAPRPRRDDQRARRGLRRRPRRAGARARRRAVGVTGGTGPGDHRPRGRPGRGVRQPGARGGHCPAGPRARHHRHRRLRQELAHRRAAAPLPARPGGQAPDRGHRRRPDPAQGRRRAAGRPHPHEQHRRRRPEQDLLPLAGHPYRRRPRCPSTSTTSSPPARPPATTSWSSRRRASARATRRSCRSSTWRCTS